MVLLPETKHGTQFSNFLVSFLSISFGNIQFFTSLIQQKVSFHGFVVVKNKKFNKFLKNKKFKGKILNYQTTLFQWQISHQVIPKANQAVLKINYLAVEFQKLNWFSIGCKTWIKLESATTLKKQKWILVKHHTATVPCSKTQTTNHTFLMEQ